MRAFSIPLGAAPLAVSLVRATSASHDFRLLWMAVAALGGASLVTVMGHTREHTARGALALSAVALGVAVILASSAAVLSGARAAPGILAIALVFGFCCSASCTLAVRSRAN